MISITITTRGLQIQTRVSLHKLNMSGNSSVGTSGIYEAGDQRNLKNSEMPQPERYEEGKENSHLANDSSMDYSQSPKKAYWMPDADMSTQKTNGPSPTAWPPRRRRANQVMTGRQPCPRRTPPSPYVVLHRIGT